MRVILESPYRAVDSKQRRLYTAYARRAVLDSLRHGESPIAFHLWFTRFLDDGEQPERDRGIWLSQQWYAIAHKIVVYADHGISDGMIHGIKIAAQLGRPIEHRYILRG